MNAYVISLFSLLAGYLIGSISFAVLITRAKGVDIFSVGSGNPGATNVLRVLGKPYGYTCFLLDAFKGVAAVLIGRGLSLQAGLDPQLLGIIGLLGAILGHSFSLFLKFKGGKGVATTVGGLFTLLPLVMLIGAILWLIVFLISRYVSLASLVLGVSLPVSAFFLKSDQASFWLCVFLAILILVRHRANIQRLLAGTENRAGRSRKS
ncbi:glycerol-3-phosphate 1-O-acyltransferase PlsY [Puniceicoccales bacterium CK1056]|uniref:Glycerol-3-phosphate acyltransferase n=1 Tax=Oceanipulchritudo coccoides TaxID=2706888 RepID=A0A6B2LYQ2_9BACT|nr:glycerol-3-phosphate 1-O-acyltransferase PlsY [Oceanipulchritudo coccoides]